MKTLLKRAIVVPMSIQLFTHESISSTGYEVLFSLFSLPEMHPTCLGESVLNRNRYVKRCLCERNALVASFVALVDTDSQCVRKNR